MIRHAINIGWLKNDPSLGIKRPKLNEIRSWTDDEIAQFEGAWPIGSKQRTAFALHLFTGQRVSHVHRMTWADVDSGSLRVTQVKTGAKLTITLHSALREVLTSADRGHVAILVTEYGKTFSVKGYGQWLRAAITKAALPLECQPHGLRKAAGRRLAEAGCSANEIMAILGHKSLAEAERYTRNADQPRLATSGITRLEDRARTALPKPSNSGLGHDAEKRRI